MRSKFSKSDIFAPSCASCACRWESWRDLEAAEFVDDDGATEARDCVRVWVVVVVPGVRVGLDILGVLVVVVLDERTEVEDVLLMWGEMGGAKEGRKV